MELTSFQRFFKHFEPDELLPFLISDNIKHPRFIHFLNVHLDIITQVDFFSEILTDAQFRIRINGPKKRSWEAAEIIFIRPIHNPCFSEIYY